MELYSIKKEIVTSGNFLKDRMHNSISSGRLSFRISSSMYLHLKLAGLIDESSPHLSIFGFKKVKITLSYNFKWATRPISFELKF
jgi:hypothetical protein